MSGLNMRIIAGSFKGMRLKAPTSQHIRPTSDRVREFIFSCIQMDIVDASVLDLFAGTGAFGIEALSRGAKNVVFVDSSRDSIELVKQNLALAKSTATVLRSNALSYVKHTDQQFDFVFCDPPYAIDNFSQIMQTIVEKDILTDTGFLIYESSSRHEAVNQPGLRMTRQKKMGDTLITFYQTDYENSNLSRNV